MDYLCICLFIIPSLCSLGHLRVFCTFGWWVRGCGIKLLLLSALTWHTWFLVFFIAKWNDTGRSWWPVLQTLDIKLLNALCFNNGYITSELRKLFLFEVQVCWWFPPMFTNLLWKSLNVSHNAFYFVFYMLT